MTDAHDFASDTPAAHEEVPSEERTSVRVSGETLDRFAYAIGGAVRSVRGCREWTRKEFRRRLGSVRTVQALATHELGTRAMSVSQFAEYCHALGIQPGPLVDQVYDSVFGPHADETVTVDLDKLAVSEHSNLARWAKLRLATFPPFSRHVLDLPLHAQNTLAVLCGFERRQLLEILGVA
ncbi:hypothetical protein [Amycolatopsis minnesotensis]|uniref:Helix-turn-helix domain-containing protein n=1 Tax=Amycolatopsis minnesotensis TaxID=337894 RepID=A0ABP5CCF3_9PSEU